MSLYIHSTDHIKSQDHLKTYGEKNRLYYLTVGMVCMHMDERNCPDPFSQQSTTIHNLASNCQSLPKLPDIHPITESASKTSISWSIPDLRRRQWHPTPVLLPGKSHGWKSLVGCSPWSHEELDMTERLHFHFSLSCIGEWNGNPLEYSCLDNPRDGGAWWAAVYRVTQSQTQLKRLSSSSSSSIPDLDELLRYGFFWSGNLTVQ